jgi:RimJ/RimL family protein N-acetyltransferase
VFARGGGFVGRCGVAYQHHPGEAELVYALARAAWGRGLATEAARAALTYAFAVVGLPRVVAFARAENVASRRVLEKAGMTLVGRTRTGASRRPVPNRPTLLARRVMAPVYPWHLSGEIVHQLAAGRVM